MLKENQESADLAKVICEALDEKNAIDIKVLNLKNIDAAVSDYFIICNSKNKPHSHALMDIVMEDAYRKKNSRAYSIEGEHNSQWILIDFVDVVVHIFDEESRIFYKLESLWADAKEEKLI